MQYDSPVIDQYLHEQYLKAQEYNSKWYRRLAMSLIRPLHKIGLGWKYSALLDKLNLYTVYTGGRSQYSGKQVY